MKCAALSSYVGDFFRISKLEDETFLIGLLALSPAVKENLWNLTNVIGKEYEWNSDNFNIDSSINNNNSVLGFQNQVSVPYKSLSYSIIDCDIKKAESFGIFLLF